MAGGTRGLQTCRETVEGVRHILVVGTDERIAVEQAQLQASRKVARKARREPRLCNVAGGLDAFLSQAARTMLAVVAAAAHAGHAGDARDGAGSLQRDRK